MKISVFAIVIFISLLVFFSSTKAQDTGRDGYKLTGMLSLDSKNISTYQPAINQSVVNLQKPERKSRVLAGLFSAILPGAGEFYAQSYLKAAIFVVIEAAAITTAIAYNNRGNSQTQMFQNYADQHWSAKQYAEWTLKNLKYLNPDLNPQDYPVIRANGTVDWVQLNNLESAIGGGYSHQLPYPGEQQYYELIGKYPQYSHGWDTSNQTDTDFHILTPQFTNYSHMRGVANDYYKVGSTAVAFVFVNHFLSIMDAVWSTDMYNDSIALKFRMEQNTNSYNLEYVPTLHVAFNF